MLVSCFRAHSRRHGCQRCRVHGDRRAQCVGRIDGEPELATNAEEESEQGEAVLDGALRHCNEWVGSGGREDAWEEAEVFKVMFVDVVVEFGLNNSGGVFLYVALGAVWGEGGEEVLGKVCPRDGRWAGGGRKLWEDVVVALQDEGVWVGGKRVECRDSGMEVEILEVCVEVDSCSSMWGGGGEIEHEVRYGTWLGVQDAKAPIM